MIYPNLKVTFGIKGIVLALGISVLSTTTLLVQAAERSSDNFVIGFDNLAVAVGTQSDGVYKLRSEIPWAGTSGEAKSPRFTLVTSGTVRANAALRLAPPVVTQPAAAVDVYDPLTNITGTFGREATITLHVDANNDGVADNDTVIATTTVSSTDGQWSIPLDLEVGSVINLVAIADDSRGKTLPADVPTIVAKALKISIAGLTTNNDGSIILSGTFEGPVDALVKINGLTATTEGSAWSLNLSSEATNELLQSDSAEIKAIVITGSQTQAEARIVATSNNGVPSLNDEPPIVGQDSVTTAEDTKVTIDVLANDTDRAGGLEPSSLRVVSFEGISATAVDGKIEYVPTANFTGTAALTYAVSDLANNESEPATVTVIVTPVNDAPTASSPALELAACVATEQTLGNDVDGDNLTVALTSALDPRDGTVSFANGVMTFTPPDFIGWESLSLSYTLSDGSSDGIVNGIVTITRDKNQFPKFDSNSLPEITALATGLRTKLKPSDLGGLPMASENGNRVGVVLSRNNLLFSPGTNEITWRTRASRANEGDPACNVSLNQIVEITSTFELPPDTKVALGSSVVPFLVDKSRVVMGAFVTENIKSEDLLYEPELDNNDGLIVVGTDDIIRFTDSPSFAGRMQSITFNGSGLNLGDKLTQTFTLVSRVSPEIRQVQFNQTSTPVFTGTPDDEVATRYENTIAVSKAESTFEIDITASDFSTSPLNIKVFYGGEEIGSQRYSLRGAIVRSVLMATIPDMISADLNEITIKVFVDSAPDLVAEKTFCLMFMDSLASLGSGDADKDGLTDFEEGYRDQNQNCVLDYFESNKSDAAPVGTDSGRTVRLGSLAFNKGSLSPEIPSASLPTQDSGFTNPTGIFDFVIVGSPNETSELRIVLPQTGPIPAGAVYRKLDTSNNAWTDFVLNEKNSVWSAGAEKNLCPSPSSDEWESGLVEGRYCLRLVIEDGGPNDDDKSVNGSVADPSAIAIVDTGNNDPIAVSDEATILFNRTTDIQALGNDTDEDNDTLAIVGAVAVFGSVTISETLISYTPETDFVGADEISYTVSDRQGGIAASTVAVDIIANRAPVASADLASTPAGTAITINVLANDSDPDNDTLLITQTSSTDGAVSVSNGSLLYTPSNGYSGTTNITYTIQDNAGGAASSTVTVEVNPVQAVVQNTNGGGGALGWMLVILGVIGVLRRYNLRLVIVAALLSCSLSANAEWQVYAGAGSAEVDFSNAPGTTTRIDDSDTSWSVGALYQMDQFDFTFQYQDMGEANVNFATTTAAPVAFLQQVAELQPLLSEGFSIGIGYAFLSRERFSAHLEGGIYIWESKVASDLFLNGSLAQSITKVDRGNDMYLGARGEFQLNDHWAVLLRYRYFDISPDSIQNWEAGLSYTF